MADREAVQKGFLSFGEARRGGENANASAVLQKSVGGVGKKALFPACGVSVGNGPRGIRRTIPAYPVQREVGR